MAATEIVNVVGIDPRLDINSRKQRINVVPQGASNISYQKTTSNNVSNSNCTFNIAVPSARTYVPRVVYITLSGNTVFTGNSGLAGQTLLQAASFPHANGISSGTSNLVAPRCMPLDQIISQLQININGQIISSNTGQYARLLQRFSNERDEREYDLSMSPMMPDVSLDYSADEMSSISPLRGAQYNDYQLPRGACPNVLITANTSLGNNNDTATVYWTFTTPLILSPMCYSRNYQEKLSFIMLTMFELQTTFGNQGGGGAIDNLSSGLWSWTNSLLNPTPPVLLSATTNIQSAFLFNQFIVPPEWQSIPPSVYYSFTVPTWLPNAPSSNTIAAGATGQIVMSQAIQRNQTMADIIFYVGERATDASIFKPDVAFFTITQLSLQWDSGAPAFSTMSPFDLYQAFHVVKGGNLSWRQFSGAGGSVISGMGGGGAAAYDASVGGSGTNVIGAYLRITPGIDIPLPEYLHDAPSCSDQKHTLLFTATVTNLTNRAIVPSANCLILDEGIFEITKLVASQRSNIVTPSEVKELQMTAGQSQPVPFFAPKSLLGGTFFGDVGQFFKRAARTGLNIAKSLAPKQYQPAVNEVSDLAEKYGVGLGNVKGGARASRKKLSMHM
jgi:hypothetical protein